MLGLRADEAMRRERMSEMPKRLSAETGGGEQSGVTYGLTQSGTLPMRR